MDEELRDVGGRCGWFGGHAGCIDTVPAMPSSSRATRITARGSACSTVFRHQRARVVDGKRQHEADAGAAVDDVGQQQRQLIEVRRCCRPLECFDHNRTILHGGLLRRLRPTGSVDNLGGG